jgi:hypothetical protein
MSQQGTAINLRLEGWAWDSNDPTHTGLQGHLCIIEESKVTFAAEYRDLTMVEAAEFTAAAIVMVKVPHEDIMSNDWGKVLEEAAINGRIIN